MKQPTHDFLKVIQLNVYFNDPDQYDVEPHDLQELFSKMKFECLNVITIKKNSFFVVLRDAEDTVRAFQKLNNFFIEALKARIEVLLCIKSDESSFVRSRNSYKALFEVEVPKLEFFGVERRFFGVDGYNIDRLRNLCEKEYFEGILQIDYLGLEVERREECIFN
jgi:hypothetical protein